MIHPELWEKIEKVEFDSLAIGKPFSAHLAAENNWTLSFAQRAIREYKRFMYLSAVSDRDLVPSDVVEQVWRLHLSDTRHYWGTFCKIAGKQLHHNPVGERGADPASILSKYKKTKALYRDEFSRDLHPDFWPPANDFNALVPKTARVDQSTHFVVGKPTTAFWRSVARFAGVATFPLSVVAYAVNQSSGIGAGAITPAGWLMVAGIAILIAIFGCLVWRMEHRSNAREKELTAEDDLKKTSPRLAGANP
ncbi:MAG: hypothetical protein QNJ29_04525 [Rhizobiaceae bacterium]|nr:hypothetical protein [Rhizobiaceae bacterium]